MEKTKKLAALCPTRNRPDQLQRMLESFNKCSQHADIFFLFQQDDPELSQNLKIIGDLPYILAGNIGLVKKTNRLCESFNGYGAYMVLNDDQVIHTEDWDSLIMEKLQVQQQQYNHRLWFPHWRDGMLDQHMPQGFATDEWVQRNGNYYCWPMRHLFTDNAFRAVGRGCQNLVYMPEIFIEHLHYMNGKAPMDPNYEQSINVDAYHRDYKLYHKWIVNTAPALVFQLRKWMGMTEEASPLPIEVNPDLSGDPNMADFTMAGNLLELQFLLQVRIPGQFNVETLLWMAQLADRGGFKKIAEDLYTEGLENNNQSFELNLNYGSFLASNADFTRACVYFQAAIKIDPDNFQAQFNLGLAYEKQNKLPEALEILKTAYSLNKQNQHLICGLSRLYLRTGSYAECRRILEQHQCDSPEAVELIRISREAEAGTL